MMTLAWRNMESVDPEIAGAVARGWTTEKNRCKEFDADLAVAIAIEVKKVLDDIVDKERCIAS